MPVFDSNGTVQFKLNIIEDTNGTNSFTIKKILDSDGTTDHVVYQKAPSEVVVANNFTRLSGSGTYNATEASCQVGATADGNVAIRQMINTSGYSTLTITGYGSYNSYQHSGFCVSTNAWTWSKANFGSGSSSTSAYIYGSATTYPSTVLLKVRDLTSKTNKNNSIAGAKTYTVDVSNYDAVYVTAGCWSFSTSGGTVYCGVTEMKLS